MNTPRTVTVAALPALRWICDLLRRFLFHNWYLFDIIIKIYLSRALEKQNMSIIWRSKE